MGIFDEVGSKGVSSGSLDLFGNSPLGKIGNALVNRGVQTAAAKMGMDKMPFINASLQLAKGGFSADNLGNIANSLVNSGAVEKMFGKMTRKWRNGKSSAWFTANPLMANLTQEEVKRVMQLAYAIEHARKNLWIINIAPYTGSAFGSLTGMISSAVGNAVSSMVGGSFGRAAGSIANSAVKMAINSTPIINALSEKGGGMESNFNMLATELNYTPFSIEAEQYNVGSAIIDGAKSSQQAEISITTMDDENGTIKRFFKKQASAIIHQDGTVGVLLDGLVQIRVLHGFVNDATNKGGFEETIICRPVGIEFDLSRREDNFEEFTMRFVQTDTFIR